MAKPLRGECEIELGGEKFTLRLGAGEFEDIEATLDVGVIELLGRCEASRRGRRGGVRFRDCRQVLRQGFIGAGIKITEEKLDALLEADRFQTMGAAVKLLMTAWNFDRGNAPAADEDAPKSETPPAA